MADSQWISFKVESETYLHSVGKIKEIIPYAAPVPVPGSPAGTEGTLNVRGNIVTVLSGRTLFDQNNCGARKSWRILILESGGDLVGVSVDSVGDITALRCKDVQWDRQASHNQLITGTLQLDDQLYILTDLSNYFRNSDENN